MGTLVSGAAVFEQDIQASNGIIHVLTSVILPPAMCVADVDCGPDGLCGEDGLCRMAPALGTCANPYPIENFDWYEGDTSEEISNELASCVGVDPAPDHVYRLRAVGPFEPFPGLPFPVCLTTLGTMYDTVIHIREEDCDGQEVACANETVLEGNDGAEVYEQAQVTLMVEMDQEYRIIIDGDNGASGRYTLGVINGACAE